MDARKRKPPLHVHEFEEGDYLIFPYDFGNPVLMYYRPPGVDMVYRAALTTDRAMQDKVGTSGTYWWWNGDPDKPSVEPSLGVPANPPYTWHGWLRDGRFEACE